MKTEDVIEIAKLQKPVLHNIPISQEKTETVSVEGKPDENIVTKEASYAPIAIVPDGMTIESLKPFIEQYAEAPERRKGTSHLKDLASFNLLTNRFKSKNSVLFAVGEISGKSVKASIQAVLNYHPESPDNVDADWNDHRTKYEFPISKFFKTWLNSDEKPMTMAEFALFLENNIADIVDPSGLDISHIDFGALKPEFAGPTDIYLLSEGIDIRSAEKFVDKKKISNGTGEIQFSVEHKDADGQPLKVPSWFVIGLPVFENGTAYAIPVRLRYRAGGGTVTWFYELFGVEKIFDNAFKEACDDAATDTGLDLFIGTPEYGQRDE